MKCVALALALASCTPAAAPVITIDGGHETVDAATKHTLMPLDEAFPDGGQLPTIQVQAAEACANLAAIGCPEGRNMACAATFEHALATSLVDLHYLCLVNAHTPDDARACKAVSCIITDGGK